MSDKNNQGARPLNAKLAAKERKLEELEAKIQAAKDAHRAAQADMQKAERREMNRIKVLLGAWSLNQVAPGANEREAFEAMKAKHLSRLDEFLTRPSDRAVFGLAPLEADKQGDAK